MTSSLIPTVNATFVALHALIGGVVEDARQAVTLTNSIADFANDLIEDAVDDALDTAGHPFQNIIRQQEEELAAVYGQLHAQQDKRDELHEVLVNVARTSSVVLDYVNQSKKINAIKELRRLTNASLRATKDAVEDPRVRDASMFVVVGFGHVGTD